MKRITADWLQGAEASAVFDALEADGAEVLAVGGCIRNHLLDHPVNDVDLSTDAWPEHVMELAVAAGLKAVPTGIEHGTVTVISQGVPHEVTTYRKDVETFGRHAKVRFSNDLREDAARRDFTMNALYARRDGTIVDPLGGLEDLEHGHLRFIGTPENRITEDYLRILRFFRFTAWYGDPSLGHDDEGLAACRTMAEGLAGLSKERIGMEIRKLLSAPDPVASVMAMQAAGILEIILPGSDAGQLQVLLEFEQRSGAPTGWLRRLALIGGGGEGKKLRLSRQETTALTVIRAVAASGEAPAIAAYRHGIESARDAMLIRAARGDTDLPQAMEAEITRGATATFPVSAKDLIDQLGEGPQLGQALKRLENLWLESDMKLDRDVLLEA